MPEKNLPGFQAWRNNLRELQSSTPAIVPRIFSTGLQKQSEQSEKYPTFQFVKLRRYRAQNERENSEKTDRLRIRMIFSVKFESHTFQSPRAAAIPPQSHKNLSLIISEKINHIKFLWFAIK